ncbi:MAG: hypothetical protein PVH85_31105 [Desulfobacterales bacterium]|jgi:hypothetical protein
MKIRSKFIVFSCLLAFAIFNLSVSFGLEMDRFPSIEIPIFKNGYDIAKNIDHGRQTHSIRYRVKTKFPAAEVLEFYDTYFNAEGWRPSFEICQRHWERLPAGTNRDRDARTLLFTSWEHPEFNLRAVLRLEYKVRNEQIRDNLAVRCQLKPISDRNRSAPA